MAKLVFGAPSQDFSVELDEGSAEVPCVRIGCSGDLSVRKGWKNASASICVSFGGSTDDAVLLYKGQATPAGLRTSGELKAGALPVPAAGGALAEAVRTGEHQHWRPVALHAGFWEGLKGVDAASLVTDEQRDTHADALVRALQTIVQDEPEQKLQRRLSSAD